MTLLITKSNITHLEPGDLLEFKRGLYSHWAVYKGDEEVIHLAGEDGDGLDVNVQHSFTIGGKMFNKANVRVDNLWNVVAGSHAYRNNSNDHKMKPLDKREIVERAMSRIGRVGYNLIYRNCEHFATWCRYNIEKSGQVESFVTGALVGLAAVAAAGMAYAFSGTKTRKQREEEEQ
ncbi:phospholipase A and acyltransferase 3-like [Gigantopelta aegis]|uniref:phospholipase A and acyltransferase 3-like n=1 Tax=Gigantopelta aegis TaxID=1735272 RepID=UPI001B889E49|nr:phospholipase A and acyltransferase 3-like [Gigantopelta aegis]